MKIKIIIRKDGTVKSDMLEGHEGSSCIEKLRETLALVGSIKSEHRKPEFYEQHHTGQVKQSSGSGGDDFF